MASDIESQSLGRLAGVLCALEARICVIDLLDGAPGLCCGVVGFMYEVECGDWVLRFGDLGEIGGRD